MKRQIKSIYIIEIIITLLIILLFFIKNTMNKYLLSIIGLAIIFFITKLIYKKNRDTNFFRKTAFRIVVSILICYFIIVYLLGLLLGFNQTLFSTNPKEWTKGLLPIFLIVVLIEKIRFVLIKNNKTEKKGYYALTILLILFNVFLNTDIFALNNSYKVFLFICTMLMPIIAQEMLSSYMVKSYGFLPTITYKLIMNLYIYLVPIITNLGDYLYSAVNIIIPFTIYMALNKYLKPDEDIRQKNKKLTGMNVNLITIPTMTFLIIIIILVSGIFRYQMIAIASNSMVPVYARGDAIILEKVDAKDIEIGDIIVFKKNIIIIAHRVVKIKEESSKRYFYTKGDANNTVDSSVINEKEILGVVRGVAKYIGYPTVWINEMFGGD